VGRLSHALAGRYRIERELGAGGMATVYLAHDERHGRPVAIKVLLPELAAALGTERFLREIRTAAALNHPHILPLLDSGDAGGILFYVMPLAGGESLRDRLAREVHLTIDDALQIAREVADALAYAHRQGVVHRDIKPENILLSNGHAVVVDFGIAALVGAQGQSKLTGTGLAVGTPTYMSPEQAAGEPADARCDVYALGCVLYEMLAGAPPFTGPSAQAVLARHMADSVPSIRTVRAAVPAAIERVVMRALAKVPADRYAGPAEFARALPRDAEAAADTSQPMARLAPQPAAAATAIAVLPFASLSTDPENEFLADGIAEEIINALARVPGLKVAARTSAFSFKGRNEDLRVVGEKLGVGIVLEGSVRRAGNRLRVTAQLINVGDGYHIWSERYDREMQDVFAIQDDVAAAIVGRMRLTLDERSGGLVRAGTTNVQAYQLYVRGRALLYRRGESIEPARAAFEEALALDPSYALAHAGLADACWYLALWGIRPPAGVIPRAREAAQRALELAPDLAEAHYARACIAFSQDYDVPTFRREFARAVELNPGYIQARCGRALYDLTFHRGDFAAALAESGSALRDDPLSAYATTIHAMVLCFAGRAEEAVAHAVRATELDPQSVVAWWHRQVIVGWSGDHAASVAAGERALELSSRGAYQVGSMAAEYGRVGDVTSARALYDELRARAARGWVPPTVLAQAAVACGQQDEALDLLTCAVDEHDSMFPGRAAFRDYDAIRSHPRFVELLRRISWI
jgi:serine/threonine-protein kinase